MMVLREKGTGKLIGKIEALSRATNGDPLYYVSWIDVCGVKHWDLVWGREYYMYSC